MSELSKPVLIKIKELIPDAPDDWAERIGILMNKKQGTIHQYCTGNIGTRNKKAIEVLKHLKNLVAEQKAEIERLTA